MKAKNEIEVEIKTDIAEKLAESLIKRVKTEQIRLVITLEGNRTVYEIEPYEPFEMKCPYGR